MQGCRGPELARGQLHLVFEELAAHGLSDLLLLLDDAMQPEERASLIEDFESAKALVAAILEHKLNFLKCLP